MPSDQISPHFAYDEMTRTNTGLANVPSIAQEADLVRLCELILEPLRALVGPLYVNSGFRSPEVNHAIGGALNSQHMRGQAADLKPVNLTLDDAFHGARASSIPFDQLILEPTWLHVSVAPLGSLPRRQCLRAHMGDQGRMVYEADHG